MASESSMGLSNQQSGSIQLPQAIHNYFEVSLYLLVLTGFGTLASTGGLDLATTVIVGAALAYRGFVLARRQRVVISERWTTPLSVAYFAFYACDFYLISRSFLSATVHLVLFAVVVRLFSLRRDRDYTTLAILAFLMVLASAVLTVDSVFLVFFSVFLLMAVITFVLMEMQRSARSANFHARRSRDEQESRHLVLSLAQVTPALVLMTLAGAAAVFFLLPRMTAGYSGGYSFGNDISTGFSDHVELGRIGQIQQSDAVVMHIRIDGDQRGQYALHWRGVGLANFDGRNWSNPPAQYALQRGADGSFAIPLFSQGLAQTELSRIESNSARLKHSIHYQVVMEPIGTNVFFLAPWARRVGGAYSTLHIDAGGAVTNLDSQHAVSIYEADSDISSPSPERLRETTGELPRFAFGYLQVPRLDPRIPRLAEEISGFASNNYDKAAALETYLKTHYAYTLRLPRTAAGDPLANFLFERKQGHCEYFASSMAIMLRTLRIPSRVVTGFRSSEFNELSGKYVIRARNAHAWVEAYFPGYGWITFDPTPAGIGGAPEGWSRLRLYVDAASSFWREWVISYDSSHQYLLGQSVASETRGSVEEMREWGRLRYLGLLRRAREVERWPQQAPGRWSGGALGVAILLLLIFNAAGIARALRMRTLQKHPERSPDEAATMWYGRMLRQMARRGTQKSSAQTAQEFVHVIEDKPLRLRVEQFIRAYEAARFGNSAKDAQRLPELFNDVESAARK